MPRPRWPVTRPDLARANLCRIPNYFDETPKALLSRRVDGAWYGTHPPSPADRERQVATLEDGRPPIARVGATQAASDSFLLVPFRSTVGNRGYGCVMLARMAVTSMLDREVYVYAEVDRLIGLHGGTAKRWINGYERAGTVYDPILRVAPRDTAWVTWGGIRRGADACRVPRFKKGSDVAAACRDRGAAPNV